MSWIVTSSKLYLFYEYPNKVVDKLRFSFQRTQLKKKHVQMLKDEFQGGRLEEKEGSSNFWISIG